MPEKITKSINWTKRTFANVREQKLRSEFVYVWFVYFVHLCAIVHVGLGNTVYLVYSNLNYLFFLNKYLQKQKNRTNCKCSLIVTCKNCPRNVTLVSYAFLGVLQ